MSNATSSILIIAGAVLAFAVSYSAGSIYIQSFGAVAMVVGGLGLSASFLRPAALPVHACRIQTPVHSRRTTHRSGVIARW